MKSFYKKSALFAGGVLLSLNFAVTGLAQSKPAPLLQDIKVQSGPSESAGEGSLVKKTSSVSAASAANASAVRSVTTSIPVLAEAAIPGNSGVLVETLDGKLVVESGSNLAFNPASNVKIATTYAVLKIFGPDYRFPTNVWTDGSYEEATGTIHGNVYISGRDPMFGFEHAIALAAEMNRMGIRNITGDLVVTDNFTMNYNSSAVRSAQSVFASLNSNTRSAAAARAYLNYLNNSGRTGQSGAPSVSFAGKVYVQPMPGNVKLLFSHESAPMREIVKVMMCYSNNFLSERLGDMLGGPYAVSRVVTQNAGIAPNEFNIQTASGLGINRVTPRAMMLLLRKLRSDLAGYNMTFADVMPVAGIDKGTLEHRFDTDFAVGSVIGKTGTLGNTDGGVSALAGEINTRGGKLLFVIFNQRGSVQRFRSFQNYYVSLVQGQFGGASRTAYTPVPLDMRLARSRIVHGESRNAGN